MFVGKEAEHSANVFYHLTYEGSVNLESVDDSVTKEVCFFSFFFFSFYDSKMSKATETGSFSTSSFSPRNMRFVTIATFKLKQVKLNVNIVFTEDGQWTVTKTYINSLSNFHKLRPSYFPKFEQALIQQIKSFGQTPHQILATPHPPRNQSKVTNQIVRIHFSVLSC